MFTCNVIDDQYNLIEKKPTELYFNVHFIYFLLVDILIDYKTHWHTFGLVLGQLYFLRHVP